MNSSRHCNFFPLRREITPSPMQSNRLFLPGREAIAFRDARRFCRHRTCAHERMLPSAIPSQIVVKVSRPSRLSRIAVKQRRVLRIIERGFYRPGGLITLETQREFAPPACSTSWAFIMIRVAVKSRTRIKSPPCRCPSIVRLCGCAMTHSKDSSTPRVSRGWFAVRPHAENRVYVHTYAIAIVHTSITPRREHWHVRVISRFIKEKNLIALAKF